MTWVKLDDGFFTDPRAIAAGRDGRSLHLAALCYSSQQLTDGLIAVGVVRVLAALAEVDPAVADLCVTAGLWELVDDGYRLVGYEDEQRTRAEIDERREAARERQRRWRDKKVPQRDSRSDHGEPTPLSQRDAPVSHDEVTRPETETETDIPPGGRTLSLRPPIDGQPSSASELVAGYVTAYQETHGGRAPLRAWRASAGKAAQEQLAAGETPTAIAGCLRVIARENKHPSTLPFVIADYRSSEVAS